MLRAVLRELLADELALVRMRIDFMRARRSTLSRNQFRRGYVAGYRIGREDQRMGRVDITRYASEHHRQVDARGIQVDERMPGLLIALWDLGLETQFSCQGDIGRFAPRQSYSGDYAAQIVFADIDDASRFVTKTIELLGHGAYIDGGFTIYSMEPWGDDTIRVEVRFSPEVLDEITALWVAFEAAVPGPTPS